MDLLVFGLGAAAGSAVTVLVPAVFNFVKKQLAYAKADLPTAAAEPRPQAPPKP